MVVQMINAPVIVDIIDIIEETPTVRTIMFEWDMDKYGVPNPGEFLMVWNFKNEKPMSISIIDEYNGQLGISVKDVGEFTHDLHQLKIGDQLGIRGSYGNGFTTEITGKRILAVGGGVGLAPINAIVNEVYYKNNDVSVVVAGTNEYELLFIDSLLNRGVDVYPCTDDGSFGFKGFATDCSLDILSQKNFDMAYVCGPEVMMKGMYDILNKTDMDFEFSFERYMKCAIGICGQCCLDPTGWRVCAEGPVFNRESISKIEEFGKYRRDASGRKI